MSKLLDAFGEERSAIADFMPFIPRARAYRSADQSIPNNAATIVTFDSEEFDTDGIHDLVTNPSRLTIQTSGVYLVEADVQWASAAIGSVRDMVLMKNGAIERVWRDSYSAAGNVQLYRAYSVVRELVKGDYLELRLFQDSGGAINTFGGVQGTALGVTYIGPGFQAVRAKPVIQYVTAAQFSALSPIDGDEVYLIADATNGIIWHLRYNAGSSSAYKWEFLGGSALTSEIIARQIIGSTGAWVDLATAGPSIVVPRAGYYQPQVSWQGFGGGGTNAYYWDVGLRVGATDPAGSSASVQGYQQDLPASQAMGWSNGAVHPPLLAAAGDTIKMRYQQEGASGTGGNMQIGYRRLALVPTRIS